MKERIGRALPFAWQDLLHPFWHHLPLWLRRGLIWAGSAKFLVGVAAVCLDPTGRMLLLEHRFHNEYPWGLPGGWLDRGENPEEGILREIWEETRLRPTEIDLLTSDGDGVWVELYFLCRVPATEPEIQRSEARSFRWVNPAEPGLRLTPRQRRAVTLAVQRLRHDG